MSTVFSAAPLRTADAACCVAYESWHVEATVDKAEKSINAEIAMMESSIVEALRQATGQLSGNMKEGLAGNAQIADLADKRDVQRALEKERLDATSASISGASTCNVVTGTVGSQDLEAASKEWAGSVSDLQVAYDAGEAGAATAGKGPAIEARLEMHCRLYATQEDVDRGICKTVASEEDGMAGKDRNVRTLLDAKNSVLSPKEQDAAVVFLNGALNPSPLGAVSSGMMQSENGRAIAAKREDSIKRQSIINNVGTTLASRYVPMDIEVVGTESGKVSAQVLKDWAEATSKLVLGYDPDPDVENFPDGVSYEARMELQSKSWFMNPTWAIANDAATEPTQVLKDMAMMQAFQIYQNYDISKTLRETSLSLATIASILEAGYRQDNNL
ncbi:hypothetical protein TH5_09290 [Thalassospira xianhensis MCCC 1A02616]|nr:hypothetical protein TH5_09290 [Thalassospira xianhensis MCCC 1A02616]